MRAFAQGIGILAFCGLLLEALHSARGPPSCPAPKPTCCQASHLNGEGNSRKKNQAQYWPQAHDTPALQRRSLNSYRHGHSSPTMLQYAPTPSGIIASACACCLGQTRRGMDPSEVKRIIATGGASCNKAILQVRHALLAEHSLKFRGVNDGSRAMVPAPV